jgi:YD repeat-containing protein
VRQAIGTPAEVSTTYTWHSPFRAPTQIVSPGLTTTNTYDAAGNLLQRVETDTTTHTVPYSTSGRTRVWTYTYGTAGLLDTVDGPLPGAGDLVNYDYTPTGALDKVTDELGHITDIVTVNHRGQPTEVTDPNGKRSALAYDSLGRLTTVTALGTVQRVTAFEYDAVGQVTKVTLPDLSFLRYTYSNARRLRVIENNAGQRVDYTYNFLGNVTSTTVKSASAAVVESHTRTFDELGRLLVSVGAATAQWTNSYDKVGNLVAVTDPRQNVFSYAYDGLDRLISTTDEGVPQSR